MGRRNATAGQAFLTIEQSASALPAMLPAMTQELERAVPVQAINTGAELLEAALGRPLFPLRQARIFPAQKEASLMSRHARAYGCALWEVNIFCMLSRLSVTTFGRDILGSNNGPMAVYDFSEGVVYLDRRCCSPLCPDKLCNAINLAACAHAACMAVNNACGGPCA